MNNALDLKISKALNVLEEIGSDYRYEKICELSSNQLLEYITLLKEFKRVNKISKKTPGCPKDIDAIKGKSLENLASYLLKISGGIFSVDKNLRNTTNEIDQLVKLNQKGKVLLTHGLIESKLANFIGECKNYNKNISVTYVGKFSSLLLSNQTKLGILFSYHGVSGQGWSNAAGLIKKFYLHKENLLDRYCIIDFNIKDFDSIAQGKNLLQIVDEKLAALQYDTDYSRFLSKHPAEL